MNKMIAWFADNHVAANLLMIFCVLGGIMTALTIKVEVFPETELDRISVVVEYPGASPSEVEESVVRRIEEKVAGLAGVRKINSISKEGIGIITIELLPGWELDRLLDDVKAEVDRITSLPEEAEQPVVREVTRRTQVVWVGVFGDAPESTLKALAEQMQDDITNLPDVTQAELFGVRQGEIHVEIDEKTLRRYGLTLGRVANIIASASLDLPAGSIKTGGSEILVRAKGRRYHAGEYADIPIITQTDGRQITLGQIANLRDDFVDSDLYARMQGKPAALVQVFRVADQNALDVADQVHKYVASQKPSLPAGVDVDFFGDQSVVLKSRLDLLLRNLSIGLVLVALVLWAFLEWRLSFWVAFGIPVSFCIGLWALPAADISINMISLFAFILVLGIVVDDAIVVGENVFKYRESGMPALQAAIKGAQEVGGPVVFSVLTTVVAFAPLMMGTGMTGKLLRNIPTVVIVVLVGSLLESLFVLPSHLARSKQRHIGKQKPRKEKFAARWLKRFIQGPYDRLLAFCLKWRYATLALGICALLLSAGVYQGGWVKFTLFPVVESDVIQVLLTMAPGTSVERTTQVVNQLEKAAQESILRDGESAPSAHEGGNSAANEGEPGGKKPLLKHMISLVGVLAGDVGPHSGPPATGGHVASIFAQLLEGEERDVTALELAGKWRKKMGPVADAESITYKSEIFSPGQAVEVHLSSADQAQLIRAVEELKHKLNSFPGVFDTADSFEPGKDELQIKLKPSGRTLGLTLAEVSAQVRHAFYGAEALRLQRDKDEVKVMVRYPDAQRHSLSRVAQMRIRTPEGLEVPFEQVAQVSLQEGYSAIERAQRRRVVRVTADVDEAISNANEVREVLTKKVMPQLVSKYPGLNYDMEGAAREQRESMNDVMQGMLLALFGIYILLAVPFRSFSQPFIVMLAIPFGVVGALAGHLLMGLNLSMLSLFGIVGLAGVVVNDSLLLVFTANGLRADDPGLSPQEAIREAGRSRFRPILLTSVTTFAGLAPIIWETSLQAKFLVPMAVSLGFGVMGATGITLLLIPCGYLVREDLLALTGRIFSGRKQDDAQD